MLPPVPAWIPRDVQQGGVEPELKAAADVAAQYLVAIEITTSQGQVKLSMPLLGQESQSTPSEERLAVAGAFASNEKRSESAIRKHRWSIRIGQERIVVSTQIRIAENIECTF